MNPIILFITTLLKKQPTRILMYIAVGILIGNWLGVQYPKQSVAFWAMPLTALIMAIVALCYSLKNNSAVETAQVIAKFTTPDNPPNDKEAAILAKAGIEVKL